MDLSSNKFECNTGIVRFVGMMVAGSPDKKRPEVVDWDNGNGYVCKDSNEKRRTFKEFVETGDFLLASTFNVLNEEVIINTDGSV